jgi:hypothetical protein
MPADDAKQLMASTSVSFATVEVSPTASVDELTVTMTVEDRPGVLSRVLEEMYEANYEVRVWAKLWRKIDSVSPRSPGYKPVTDYLCHRLDAPPASHGQHCATTEPGRTPAPRFCSHHIVCSGEGGHHPAGRRQAGEAVHAKGAA